MALESYPRDSNEPAIVLIVLRIALLSLIEACGATAQRWQTIRWPDNLLPALHASSRACSAQ